MSQLIRLKQQLLLVGQDARQQAQALLVFKPRFSQAAALVNDLIGGTTQRADQEMIAALQAAQQKIDEAIAALQQATSTAERCAGSL